MLLFPPILHGMLGFFLVSIIAISLFMFPGVFAEEWTIEIKKGASEKDAFNAFTPNNLAFSEGDVIRIVNNDSISHHITSGLPNFPDYYGYFFDAGITEPSKTSTIPLKEIKNEAYYYLCQIHPWMTGKLFVKDTITAQPETENPISTNKQSFTKGETVNVKGTVHKDFWGSKYQIQIYNEKNKLVDIVYGNFDDESSYVENINTNMFESSGTYKLNLVYALPSKVAKTNFELSNDSMLNQPDIPSWIKNVSNLWCSSQINDTEFLNVIEHMVENKIINIDPKAKIYSDKKEIPSWVKNNTCLWSNNQISDIEFIAGIEYLISNGAIKA